MTDVAVSQTNAGSGAGALERAAEELATMARELAPETEHARRLPGALVAQLRESGLLRAGAPAAVGAAQAPPAVTLSAAETIARGDASAGWCVAIGATSSLLGGWLPAEGLAEVLGDVNSVAAGVWAPRGAARRGRLPGVRPVAVLQRHHALGPPVRRLHAPARG
jgi:alkylation response protein AidB-like acyl-CoA dehydrogenase